MKIPAAAAAAPYRLLAFLSLSEDEMHARECCIYCTSLRLIISRIAKVTRAFDVFCILRMFWAQCSTHQRVDEKRRLRRFNGLGVETRVGSQLIRSFFCLFQLTYSKDSGHEIAFKLQALQWAHKDAIGGGTTLETSRSWPTNRPVDDSLLRGKLLPTRGHSKSHQVIARVRLWSVLKIFSFKAHFSLTVIFESKYIDD